MSKERAGTRQTKKITISDHVNSFFVLSQCVCCSPASCFYTTWPSNCKGSIVVEGREVLEKTRGEKMQALRHFKHLKRCLVLNLIHRNTWQIIDLLMTEVKIYDRKMPRWLNSCHQMNNWNFIETFVLWTPSSIFLNYCTGGYPTNTPSVGDVTSPAPFVFMSAVTSLVHSSVRFVKIVHNLVDENKLFFLFFSCVSACKVFNDQRLKFRKWPAK